MQSETFQITKNSTLQSNELIWNFTLTGLWSHVKRWLNTLGGTREDHIQERLDEWMFHTHYLNPEPEAAFYRMLIVIGEYGHRAKNRVMFNNMQN